MQDTICLTYIYNKFWGTKQFEKSCKLIGIPFYNAWKINKIVYSNAEVIKALYTSMKTLKSKYKNVIYADSADSFWQRYPKIPYGKFIYSTEKKCFPHTYMEAEYIDRQSPWCFLNAGGWCAEIDLAIEYFERFGLLTYDEHINGQHEHMLSYFKALKEGFPIELDQTCSIFQTTAFEEPGDFRLDLTGDGKAIINNITGTLPCILHGNGRTDMTPIYNRYK